MRFRPPRATAALAGCLLLGLAVQGRAQTTDAPVARPMPRPLSDSAALAGPEAAPREQAPSVAPSLRVAPAGTTVPADPLAHAVLTVDQEAMYRQSAWGQRAERQIAQQSRQVAADNDSAFAALVSDEDALTAARATLGADEFRKRAAAFDARVTAVRQERDAARADLARMAERDRSLFFQAAAPVLSRVMEARGARVVLDQRTVLISDERIDVTAATIAALDRALGDGAAIVAAAGRKEAEYGAAQPVDSTRPGIEGGDGARTLSTPPLATPPSATPAAGVPAASQGAAP